MAAAHVASLFNSTSSIENEREHESTRKHSQSSHGSGRSRSSNSRKSSRRKLSVDIHDLNVHQDGAEDSLPRSLSVHSGEFPAAPAPRPRPPKSNMLMSPPPIKSPEGFSQNSLPRSPYSLRGASASGTTYIF